MRQPANPTTEVHRGYLSLGANIGDRIGTIAQAIAMLDGLPETRTARVSSLYETEPVGFTEQPEFINCVVEIETRLDAPALLAAIHDIERILGRVERSRWREREIDIDILLYDDLVVDVPGLLIPHPEMQRRQFVLVPLAEIAPDALHPLLRATATELLATSSDDSAVRRLRNDSSVSP